MTDNTNVSGIVIGIVGVFVGCCLNAVFLEYLVRADSGSGTLATFLQYVFIASEGYIFTMKCGTKRRVIPLSSYIVIVVMFLVANVTNNYVFRFNISMPLHMIFRSGSLITNMLMGIVLLKKKYTLMKFLSVALISVGVLTCTLVTGKEMKDDTSVEVEEHFFWWLVGISILVFALFVSSLLGIYQEKLYATFGKHPNEALFYTHLLPIPCFILFAKELKQHMDIALASAPLEVPILKTQVPSIGVYLLANVLTQYICIKSVYRLATEASSLSVTLVLTLRKFFSLILSILYFNNSFTLYHWIGTLCVFVGTIVFTEIPQKLSAMKSTKKTKTS